MLWFTGGTPRPPGALRRAGRWFVRAVGALGTTATALVVRAQVAWAQYAPDPGQGPGGPQLQQLVNWGGGLILIACVGFIGLHAARWGWGSRHHNMAMVQDGKEGISRGALVAGIVAAAAGLVKFASGLGGQIQ